MMKHIEEKVIMELHTMLDVMEKKKWTTQDTRKQLNIATMNWIIGGKPKIIEKDEKLKQKLTESEEGEK